MSTELFYFSGTGNSLYIVKYLSERLKDSKITSIAALNSNREIYTDAKSVGIIFPVYFLTAPDYVVNFIKRLKVSKDAYVFAIANAGAMEGNTLIHVKKLLSKNNIALSGAFSVFLPDNSIIFPTEKSKHQQVHDDCKKTLDEIVNKIQMKGVVNPKKGPISNSMGVGKFLKFYSDHILGFDDFRLNTDACNGCGLCEKVCPVKNIVLEDNKPQWSDNCTMCFACIHWCPKQAVEFKNQKVHQDFQYTHPDIQVQELIKRNNAK